MSDRIVLLNIFILATLFDDYNVEVAQSLNTFNSPSQLSCFILFMVKQAS